MHQTAFSFADPQSKNSPRHGNNHPHRNRLELAILLRMEPIRFAIESATVPSNSGRSRWVERHEELWKVRSHLRCPVLDSSSVR